MIVADPKQDPERKEQLVRAFAQAIEPIRDYIPGPDMGTNETAMAWVRDEIGRAVGLPPELGGIPLDEIGATGFGVTIAAEAVEVGASTLWLQLGIWSDEAAEIAHDAGLGAVMNRCLKIEHARFAGGLHLAGFDTGVISSHRR